MDLSNSPDRLFPHLNNTQPSTRSSESNELSSQPERSIVFAMNRHLEPVYHCMSTNVCQDNEEPDLFSTQDTHVLDLVASKGVFI